MKPFSTPVLSKRTYRELKLLKHLQHENVGPVHALSCCCSYRFGNRRLSVSATSSYLLLRICTSPHNQVVSPLTIFGRYFVTELLGTDLHRLLTSRPLEKQFIQYFLYQILVGPTFSTLAVNSSSPSAVSNTCIRPVLSIGIWFVCNFFWRRKSDVSYSY